jgi:hypothetical protein
MHGLTGGSWKRSSPATDTMKNDTRKTALVTVASRPTAETATAPAPDPPVAGGWQVRWDTPTAGR